jgi:hypothetical protein
MLIYGQPGLGKSTLALSAPQPLMVDFDGGIHRVAPVHLTDTVQVESWQNMMDLFDTDLSAYKTIIIDTAGKMLDYMGAHIIKGDAKYGKGGALTLQGYGVRKGMFQRFLGQAATMGKHLVFVAHEKEEKDGDQKIIRPEIGGSSGGDLIKDLDLVGYMEAKGKLRTISFDPCEKFYGKNTCGLDPLITLPDLEKNKNDLLVSVFERFAQGLQNRNAMMGSYSALLADIRAKLDLVHDADMANAFVTYLQSTQHIWDSMLQGRSLLREKVKVLGLVSNKEKGLFEAPAASAVSAAPTAPAPAAEPAPATEAAASPEPAADGQLALDAGVAPEAAPAAPSTARKPTAKKPEVAHAGA